MDGRVEKLSKSITDGYFYWDNTETIYGLIYPTIINYWSHILYEQRK